MGSRTYLRGRLESEFRVWTSRLLICRGRAFYVCSTQADTFQIWRSVPPALVSACGNFTFLCLDLLKPSSGMAYARLEVVPARLKSPTWLSEPEFNGAEVAPAYYGLRRQSAVSPFVRKTARSLHDFRAFHTGRAAELLRISEENGNERRLSQPVGHSFL